MNGPLTVHTGGTETQLPAAFRWRGGKRIAVFFRMAGLRELVRRQVARREAVGQCARIITRRRRATATVLACAALAFAGSAWAQAFPTRPIRLVIGFPAGGTIDGLARTIAAQVGSQVGGNVVVDNRGGANGMIATEIVIKAPPDGYTLLFSPPALIVNQILGKARYDVLRDLVPVANTGLGEGSLLVVHPSVPAKSVQELIALAKVKSLTYGTPGIGNTQHLVSEMFNIRAGTRLVHVPYKGIAPAVTGVVSGEVNLLFGPPAIIVQHIKAGRLRALAFTGEKRWNLMPELPTVAESGLPGFKTNGAWQGIFAPAKTPADIITRLHAQIAAAVEVPKVRDFILAAGYDPDASDSAQFRSLIEADFKRYADIIRIAGIKLE
ncbi:MAG: tripartite tricarboxylate transporter substrate binding protein [Burkholderiales bacterium]|nr:tripartite tricarboxylate transporter substrate binding protein [Burkholderiales bacterium]